MGKRELLIVVAFAAVGIVTYQLTAVPSDSGRRRFSLRTVLDEFRRGGPAPRATASATTAGTLDAPDSLMDLRISNVAHLTVTGETRDDIHYTLTVESGGPNEASARTNASATRLAEDRLGPILALRAAGPDGGHHVATLTLLVPERLRVRVEGAPAAASLSASDVAAIQLESVAGDVRLTNIDGSVTGSHRNGDLVIASSGSVALTVLNSQTTLEGPTSAVTLRVRNGRCLITGAGAPVEIDTVNADVSILGAASGVRLTGSGGRAVVDDPQGDVYIDLQRTTLDLTVTRETPITALTTDAPLTLRIAGLPAMTVDAVATDASITGDGVALSVEDVNGDARVRHVFGDGATVVSLRNRRAPIVISRTK